MGTYLNEDYKKLIYRRQFYLTPRTIDIDGLFNYTLLNNDYHLYTHIDLNFTYRKSGEKSLYILGDIFDGHNPSYTNDDIIDKLMIYSFNDLVIQADIYAGRYVIIYCDENNIQIFNDAATSRKVFYAINSDQVWCGSQPHVLADILNIPKTTDKDKLQYFESEYFFKNELIGIYHHTIYDEIFQLSPNHFLDYKLKKCVRFWPYQPVVLSSLEMVTRNAGDLLKGYMNAIHHRYKKLMMAVTAGMDSRFLLAASKDISQHVFYYINRLPGMNDDNMDIRIGKRVTESLGLDFHILEPDQQIDEKFKEIYLKNTVFPYESRLSLIYNIYYKRFPDYINLPGNFSEVGRNAWYFYRSKITGKDMVNLTFTGDFKYAINKSSEWISEVKDICRSNNVNILDLQYWENRITTWGTHFQASKDIAQEEVLPLNSRQLMTILLSSKRKYRDEDVCYLHRRMIKYLWKEALDVPVNPTFTKFYFKLLKHIGLFRLYFMVKHHFKILYLKIHNLK